MQARQIAEQKAELRRECARLRGKLLAGRREVARQTHALTSWKHYAREYPAPLLGLAAAAGLWLGSGRRLSGIATFLARQATVYGLSQAWGPLMTELARAFASRPDAGGPTDTA